jgi:hypothetical protein
MAGAAMIRLALAAALLCSTAAVAQDETPAVAIGGLMFEGNDSIAYKDHRLTIKSDEIHSLYQHQNKGKKPVKLMIAFPLPDLPLPGRDPNWVEYAFPDWLGLGMKLTINGKPAELTQIDIPKVGETDISARLTTLGWPVRYWEDGGFAAKLAALSADDKSQYVGEGLLVADESAPGGVRAAWRVSSSFVRMQEFAAGKTTSIDFRYAPMTGGGFSTSLDREFRDTPLPATADRHRLYCPGDSFFDNYDAQRYTPDGGLIEPILPIETRLSYRANDRAHAKFNMVIDKGYEERLLTHCIPGGKFVGETKTEFKLKRGGLDADVKLLIVNLTTGEGP